MRPRRPKMVCVVRIRRLPSSSRLFWIVVRVFSQLFFIIIIYFIAHLFHFRWVFLPLPFGAEPPALSCGSAWRSPPFLLLPMPSDLPCTVALDISKFPAAASLVDISSAARLMQTSLLVIRLELSFHLLLIAIL